MDEEPHGAGNRPDPLRIGDVDGQLGEQSQTEKTCFHGARPMTD